MNDEYIKLLFNNIQTYIYKLINNHSTMGNQQDHIVMLSPKTLSSKSSNHYNTNVYL